MYWRERTGRLSGMTCNPRPQADHPAMRAEATGRSRGLYLLVNEHSEAECSATFAAWRGFESALRRAVPVSGCTWNDHRIWWRVEAGAAEEALCMLPSFVARRTVAVRVFETPLP